MLSAHALCLMNSHPSPYVKNPTIFQNQIEKNMNKVTTELMIKGAITTAQSHPAHRDTS
jgi:hypothetical protein